MVEMTGKLWGDTSKGKRTLAECIQAAKASYRRGFGKLANVCYIHPDYRPNAPAIVDGVQIKRDRHVSPYYYWIGCNGDEPELEEENPEPTTEPSSAELEVGYYKKCPHCKAEQLVKGARCWDCERDLKIKEAA